MKDPKDTLSYAIEEARNDMSATRTRLREAVRTYGWKDRIEHVEGLLTCGLVALHDSREELLKFEIKQADEERGESRVFNVRGIGKDNTPGCFVCGGDHGLHSNLSAFTDSKESGELIVNEWFLSVGARLDFRPSEPNWIQVKVGACEKHLPHLRQLGILTGYYARIRQADVQDAINFACPRDTNGDGDCGQPACPNCGI